jgi:hypothetical protein
VAAEMTCPFCGSAEYTRLRRWWMGKLTAWWCGCCVREIPPVRLVRYTDAAGGPA